MQLSQTLLVHLGRTGWLLQTASLRAFHICEPLFQILLQVHKTNQTNVILSFISENFRGLVLQDLTFVHIGNVDFLADGKVNWIKRWQQWVVLEPIRRFHAW